MGLIHQGWIFPYLVIEAIRGLDPWSRRHRQKPWVWAFRFFCFVFFKKKKKKKNKKIFFFFFFFFQAFCRWRALESLPGACVLRNVPG